MLVNSFLGQNGLKRGKIIQKNLGTHNVHRLIKTKFYRLDSLRMETQKIVTMTGAHRLYMTTSGVWGTKTGPTNCVLRQF